MICVILEVFINKSSRKFRIIRTGLLLFNMVFFQEIQRFKIVKIISKLLLVIFQYIKIRIKVKFCR